MTDAQRRAAGTGRRPRPVDPGMARKMGPAGFAALPDLVAGRSVDVEPLLERARFVDARIDCADFRALTLARVVHADRANARAAAGPDVDGAHAEGRRPWRLPSHVSTTIADSLTGFRYSLDVPGTDSMCLWSENHQVVVAVAEHAAGLLYPGRRFAATGATGASHAEAAARRLRTWLADRFRIGFIEWLSPTYYEEDAAALAVLIDVTDDDDLRERARGVLDLLTIDLALHSTDGVLVGSAGRAYVTQKKAPRTQEIAPVLAHLLLRPPGDDEGGAAGGAADASGTWDAPVAWGGSAADRLGGLLRVSSYRAPAVARAIVADGGPLLVQESFGLDLREVADYVGEDDLERTGHLLWAMESFTDPESVRPTMTLMDRWDMWDNRFLAPLAGFRHLPRPLLPALTRLVDPASRGVAITRADVVTWRSGGLALSSAQHHNVGRYGDQQHLWQATLPGAVPVFATHPGRAMFDDVARNFSPSAWTGNGRNPDVAQDGQVLLALHRLPVRHGYLERHRHRWTHLYWPEDRFDHSEVGEHWAVAVAGEGMVGVRSLAPVRRGETGELVQAGDVTGWAVVVAHADAGLDALRTAMAGATMELGASGTELAFSPGAAHGTARPAGETTPQDGSLPHGEWILTWQGGLERDGMPVGGSSPRLRFGDTDVERFPERIVVRHGGHALELTEAGRVHAAGPQPTGEDA